MRSQDAEYACAHVVLLLELEKARGATKYVGRIDIKELTCFPATTKGHGTVDPFVGGIAWIVPGLESGKRCINCVPGFRECHRPVAKNEVDN